MALSIFEKATEVSAKVSKAKKTDREEIRIAGLRDYAVLDNLEKAIKAKKETLRVAIDDAVLDTFLAKGGAVFVGNKKIKDGFQPDNFRGVDDVADASCELRKRDSRRALDAFQIEALNEYGIETETVGDVAETFIFNPELVGDQEIMAKVAKALEKVKGLPDNLIQKQVANKKVVTTDNSIRQVMNLKPEIARTLLPVVSTVAVGKAKLPEDYTVSKLVDVAKGVLSVAGPVEVSSTVAAALKVSAKK